MNDVDGYIRAQITPTYSRAFERLVNDNEDLVGLLAYAIYKQSVRENALAGQSTTNSQERNLPPAMVGALRQAAEMRLTEAVSLGIQQAIPDIQNAAIIGSINANQTATITAPAEERENIKSHITNRTGFVGAFFVNISAWAAALVVTVLILIYSGSPPLEDAVKNQVQSLGNGKIPTTEAERPILGGKK